MLASLLGLLLWMLSDILIREFDVHFLLGFRGRSKVLRLLL